MEKTGRTVSFLWLALALVALTGTIVFSVFAGISAGASGRSSPSPVTLEAGAESLAEDSDYVVVSDKAGGVKCYEKAEPKQLWEYSKAASDGAAAKATAVALFGQKAYVLFDDRTVMRFDAETGEAEGVLETNYVPKRIYFSPEGGTLFAVYGEVGAKRDVYLLRTDFGGTEESPASYRDYPKLDSGDYAISSGGVETGVQGILITADERIYIASDAYTVRLFTANGMADGYREFPVAAEKLAAFCETEDGFAGLGLDGSYYRFDKDFVCKESIRIAQTFTFAVSAGKTLYGTDGHSVFAVSDRGEKRFALSCAGETLLFADQDTFVLSGAELRWLTAEQARQISVMGGLFPVFLPLAIVFALFLCYAGASVWTPLRARVNRWFAVVGRAAVRHRFAYLGLIPTFALLAVFYYWPIVRGFGLSFFNYNGVTSKFVGLQNFIDVLYNTLFWDSALTMLILLVTDIVKAIVPPLLFAEFILAVRNKQFSFIVRVLLFIPGILPGVAGTLVWVNGIFGSDSYGLLNSICSIFVPGFIQTWIGPYLETRSLVSIIMFAFPWVGSYLIFYGGVMGIPKSLFEAAELDGCGWWRRIATIDLPLIFAQIKYIFITSFIASVQDYGRLFITDQATGHGLKVPALIIYENIYKGGSEPNYGLSSAMSMYLFAFLLIATILNFRKQTDKEAM